MVLKSEVPYQPIVYNSILNYGEVVLFKGHCCIGDAINTCASFYLILSYYVIGICRCGRFPPEVRTAIPVDGRFEHIVLSCNATSDHGIIWIEKEAEKALKVSFSLYWLILKVSLLYYGLSKKYS